MQIENGQPDIAIVQSVKHQLDGLRLALCNSLNQSRYVWPTLSWNLRNNCRPLTKRPNRITQRCKVSSRFALPCGLIELLRNLAGSSDCLRVGEIKN